MFYILVVLICWGGCASDWLPYMCAIFSVSSSTRGGFGRGTLLFGLGHLLLKQTRRVCVPSLPSRFSRGSVSPSARSCSQSGLRRTGSEQDSRRSRTFLAAVRNFCCVHVWFLLRECHVPCSTQSGTSSLHTHWRLPPGGLIWRISMLVDTQGT